MSTPRYSDHPSNTEHLNETHKNQIIAYLEFFRHKLREQTNEIEREFDDFKDMRLTEDSYSSDDVAEILDGLKSIVKGTLRDEFERYSFQSVLFLRQLFLQAEGHAVSLAVDTSTLDDAVLLAKIEQLNLESQKKKKHTDMDSLPDTRKLNSINGAVDVKLVTKIKDLEEANKNVLNRFDKLQQQCMAAQQENIELRERVSELKDSLKTARRDVENLKRNDADAQQDEIEDLRRELRRTREDMSHMSEEHKNELREFQKTLEGKVNNTPQFLQIKKMLVQRNEQLKELRARIRQLEEQLGE